MKCNLRSLLYLLVISFAILSCEKELDDSEQSNDNTSTKSEDEQEESQEQDNQSVIIIDWEFVDLNELLDQLRNEAESN